MATDLQQSAEPAPTSLIAGIIDDLQDLIKQQVQLTKREISQEVHNASTAVVMVIIGAFVIFFGMFFDGLGLVHLLHWASSPAGSDPASLPLWACHAIVGVPLTLLGGILTFMGVQKFRSINPLHNPAVDELKENVAWVKNPTP